MNRPLQLDRTKMMLAVAVVAALFACMFFATPAYAKKGDKYYNGSSVIAVENSSGQLVYKPQSSASKNRNALTKLLNNTKTRTVVIPSGSNFTINSPIRVGSNKVIIANGATITQTVNSKGLISNYPTKLNYKSIKNVTIVGGTWKNKKNNHAYTAFRFCHGQNINVYGVNIVCNNRCHAVEFIACKNATVNACTLRAKGKVSSSFHEDIVQIDLATPKTAPGVKKESSSKFTQGQYSSNITVMNCNIYGSRGICVNFSKTEKKYRSVVMSDITIKDNVIETNAAQGIALYNTGTAVVEGNTIKNTSSSSGCYSCGIHVGVQGNNSIYASSTIKIKNNTVYGGRQAIYVASSGGKYKSVTIKNNKCYCKKGASNAIKTTSSASSKYYKSGNTTKAW